MEAPQKRSHLKRTESVKLTVSLPRSVAAFLRWKAEMEGVKRDDLLRRVIVHYARKLRERDVDTPPVWVGPDGNPTQNDPNAEK